jgi:rare lipoprotein A (peptidoglycan hydrolase)
MAINVQKLLPSAKGSSALAISKGSSISIKKKTADITRIATLSKERNDQNVAIVRKSLIDVDSLLRSVVGEDTQTEKTKRLRKESENREERETRIEAPKEQKKFGLPKISLPGTSFLDRIKRFLFFTALGWLFTRFNQELPRLLGVVKVITSVYGVVETVFKFILSSVVSFIEKGYETYDKFRGIVKSIGGENSQEEFDKLSSKLNEYINYILVGGMALTGAINTFATNARNYKPPKPPTPTGPAPRGPVQRAVRPVQAAAIKTSRAVAGKQATRQLLRLAKGPLSRLPIVGALVEFGLSWALGDNPGKAAFRGVGTLLLGAVGSLIMPGFGTFAGGIVGAELAGKLYDVLFENKKAEAKVQGRSRGGKIKRYATGGVVGGSGRTLTTRKSTRLTLPSQTSQPGRDVGGKKEIKRLYPDPNKPLTLNEWLAADGAGTYPQYLEQFKQKQLREGKKPSAYEALEDVRDTLLNIPYGIGVAMSAAIDAAFGQNISDGTINSIVNGLEGVYSIAYNTSKSIESQSTNAVSGIASQLSGMQAGGVVPGRTGGMKKEEETDLTKFFRNDIRNKITSSIRDVQKQLALGKKKPATKPGQPPYIPGPGPGPGGGGGGGGPRLPNTGKNGRYTKSELTYIGKMNPAELKVQFKNDWYGRDVYLRPDAAAAFKAAQKEAGSKIGWIINSGYRSLEHQQALIDAGYPAAPLGTSDHGDGIALDIQDGTNGHNWLVKNGAKFGWRWPAIKGDLVHFYYDGSYKPKGQKTPVPPIFKQPDPKQKPGQLPPIFQLPGQGGTPPVKPQQPKPGVLKSGTSMASWYGPGFYGNKSAGGPVLERNSLWVAHKSLKFGTVVRFTYKGKSITLEVRDRGPFISGREWDLTEAAAEKIGLKTGPRTGTGMVEWEILKYGDGKYLASISNEKPNQFAGMNMFDVSPYTSINGDLAINPSVLMGLENAAKNVTENYQSPNILSNTKSSNTQQYIPKQTTMRDVSSLTTYPTYSEEGGMILAIQPIIIEKKVPISMGQNKATTFMISGSGSVNNTDISLSRG